MVGQPRAHLVPVSRASNPRSLGWAAGLAFALSLAACGRGAEPGSTYEVTGLVTVADGTEDGPPIGGARVVFTGDTGITAETVTNDDGTYRIGVVSDSRFGHVDAEASGYGSATESVYFDTPTRRIDLRLVAAASD